MTERLRLHFEPERGWINDPNGLIFWRGEYHAFFQHNPYAAKWDRMHWGHAVSRDLLHWEERPIALFPDKNYENSGGCFSGSAVEHDGRLYLFYTSVSHELGQTQSLAVTEDGEHFVKAAENPLIRTLPRDASPDFRDPKLTRIGNLWHMVLASGYGGAGRILRYVSDDLLHWEYAGILYENAALGQVFECPDFFLLDGRYVLSFSRIGCRRGATLLAAGDFDGECFTPDSVEAVEEGPHFYAPQTFEAPDGRRIMIGWMHSWGALPGDGGVYKGAFSLPRELHVRGGRVVSEPIREAAPYLTVSDDAVEIGEDRVAVRVRVGDEPLEYRGAVRSVSVLRDTRTVEVFVNGGERVLSYWLF